MFVVTPVRGSWLFLATILLLAHASGAAAQPAPGPAPAVYVVNTGADSVSVIDPLHNVVVNTIAVGGEPGDVAATPDGTLALVTNSRSDSVSVIDAASRTVVDTIPVGNFPNRVALGPDGSRAYVTNLNSGEVSVIDVTMRHVEQTITLGRLAGPYSVTVSPDGQRIYVGRVLSTLIDVFDAATLERVGEGRVPIDVFNIALTRDGRSLYATTDWNFGLLIVDADNFVERKWLSPCGGSCSGIAFAADGGTAYVGCCNEVDVVDVAKREFIKAIVVGYHPTGVALSTDGTLVYVANTGDDTVSVIERATNSVVQTISVGHQPMAVAAPRPAGGPALTPTQTPTNTATATASDTPTSTTTVTPTDTPSVMPSPTPTPISCVGDCDGSGDVTVNEIITMVVYALNGEPPTSDPNACPVVDQWCNGNDFLGMSGATVLCIVKAVNNALHACPSSVDAPLRLQLRR